MNNFYSSPASGIQASHIKRLEKIVFKLKNNLAVDAKDNEIISKIQEKYSSEFFSIKESTSENAT